MQPLIFQKVNHRSLRYNDLRCFIELDCLAIFEEMPCSLISLLEFQSSSHFGKYSMRFLM